MAQRRAGDPVKEATMRQVGMEIDVGPEESTAQVLERLKSAPPGSQVLLRIPKDAKAMRLLDDPVESPGGQAGPPAGVRIMGSAPSAAAAPRPTPPAPTDDIDAMNFDDAALEQAEAQYRAEIDSNLAGRSSDPVGSSGGGAI